MNIKDIMKLAKDAVGIDRYFEDYRLLKDDLDFFKLYLSRNRKSTGFWFKAVPVGVGTFRVFEEIMKAYGISDSYLEEEYAIYIMMRDIILDVYQNIQHDASRKYTDSIVQDFHRCIAKECGLDTRQYVSDFIGCSIGTSATITALEKILFPKEEETNG